MNTINNLTLKQDVSAQLSDSISSVLKTMKKNNQGVVVIVSNNLPVAILTERDILHIINNDLDLDAPVESILKFNHLITINIKRSIEYALQILINNNIRRLIVVNDSNIFLGFVTQDILIKNLEKDTFRKSLLISDFLKNTKKLICLKETHTIQDALTILNTNNIGSVIIADNKDTPIGIFTERDIIKVATNKIDLLSPITTVMSSPVTTINDNQKVEDVVSLMSEKNITRVLILNQDNKEVRSILSIRDIAYNLKGNYGQVLESKLRNVKNTLNYIGESVLELCQDNDEYIIQWTNETAIKNFGNLMDKHIHTLFTQEKWSKIYQNIKKNGRCHKIKLEINEKYFEMRCSQHCINEKESFLIIFRDISEFEYAVIDANKKNIAVQKELQILQGVIDQQKSIVIVTNGYTVISANKSLYKFFNVQDLKEFNTQYSNISIAFIEHINFFSNKDNDSNWIENILKLNTKDRIVSILDMNNFEPKAFTVQINPLNSDESEYAVTFTDITEIKLESQQYHFHATHDALTGIYNRSYYFEKISNEIAQANRYGTTFCVILLDIDHFKIFNDTYGHLKGDEVLIQVSKTIQSNKRKTDTFARWGGEEFIILLEKTASDKAELIAEHFRKLIQNIHISGVQQITASFGVTEFINGDDDNTIVKRADDALYLAKESGRNKVMVK